MNDTKFNKPGYLTYVFSEFASGRKPLSKGKMPSSDLERIATILGHLARNDDLYGILFEGENQELTVDGTVINTEDLKWFVMLDHSFSRGYFFRPNGRCTVDTSVNQSVPLAFKGARRVFNKSYMSWLTDLKIEKPEDYLRCDMFLPHGLASFHINPDTGAIEQGNSDKRNVGIIQLYKDGHEFTDEEIRDIRSQLSLKSPHTPRMVKGEGRAVEIFNNCSKHTRCLIAQTWCWDAASRHSDQINDTLDWDNNRPFVDAPSNLMTGLKPKDGIPQGFKDFRI